jgi:hypothetical protein
MEAEEDEWTALDTLKTIYVAEGYVIQVALWRIATYVGRRTGQQATG